MKQPRACRIEKCEGVSVKEGLCAEHIREYEYLVKVGMEIEMGLPVTTSWNDTVPPEILESINKLREKTKLPRPFSQIISQPDNLENEFIL